MSSLMKTSMKKTSKRQLNKPLTSFKDVNIFYKNLRYKAQLLFRNKKKKASPKIPIKAGFLKFELDLTLIWNLLYKTKMDTNMEQ